MAGERERTPYQGASIFFAGVVILFAVAGMLIAGLGPDGPGSAGFLICLLFLVLGIGRLYLGLRPVSEPDADSAASEDAEPEAPSRPPRRSVRHGPSHRRRP